VQVLVLDAHEHATEKLEGDY